MSEYELSEPDPESSPTLARDEQPENIWMQHDSDMFVEPERSIPPASTRDVQSSNILSKQFSATLDTEIDPVDTRPVHPLNIVWQHAAAIDVQDMSGA